MICWYSYFDLLIFEAGLWWGDPDFDPDEFIRKRQAACSLKSNHYLLCRPLLVLFADDRFVTYIIDLQIQAKKPQEIPLAFDFEIRKYIMRHVTNYTSADVDEIGRQLYDLVNRKFKDYFPHAELIEVKVDVIT